jgi:1-acyl-sn-glycerol-3-phosphate acyltransferase
MGDPKPGVGRLAVQSGARIVPCVIYGTWKAWPRLTPLPHPAKIVVDFLPPLEVPPEDTRENHERIARRVRDLIVAEQVNHRVGPAPSGAFREAPDY